jgi:hypothetical protein
MLLHITAAHYVPACKALRRARIEQGGEWPALSGYRHTVEVPGGDPTLGFGSVLDAMRLGESVFVPVPRSEENGHRARVISAARRRSVSIVTRFATENQVYGMRVWRVS